MLQGKRIAKVNLTFTPCSIRKISAKFNTTFMPHFKMKYEAKFNMTFISYIYKVQNDINATHYGEIRGKVQYDIYNMLQKKDICKVQHHMTE